MAAPPVTVVAPTDRQEELSRLFDGHKSNVSALPGNWLLPGAYGDYAREFQELEFEADDVVVMTFPKSGTTWALEIVWTMRNNGALDSPLALEPLTLRTPLLEGDIWFPTMCGDVDTKDVLGEVPQGYNLNSFVKSKSARTIKTHLTFDLISSTALSKAKVVYTLRDPRDVCISYFYHCRLFNYERFTGSFEQFVQVFMEDASYYAPYWAHVKAAWNRRENPNVHIMSYDQLKKNPREEYKKLDEFLKTNLSEEKLDKIIEHCSFSEMKKREHHASLKEMEPIVLNLEMVETDGGGFFKKGESGRHREVLSAEQQQRFQDWVTANCPDQALKELLMA